MKAISRESRVALTWEVLYADDLVVIAETEVYLIKRLNEWKNKVENRGMRVVEGCQGRTQGGIKGIISPKLPFIVPQTDIFLTDIIG